MFARYLTGLTLLGLLISTNASAEFGFGLCCPSPPSGLVPCGIIPCDNACSGSAINQMGGNVSSSINTLNSSYQDLTRSAQSAIDSMTSLGTVTNNTLATQNMDLLNGLSAASNRIELAYIESTKSLERDADHQVITLNTALKEVETNRAVSENNSSFGELSQPMSGRSGANLAASIKASNALFVQLSTLSTENFYNYINDKKNTISTAGAGLQAAILSAQVDDSGILHPMIAANTLNENDLKNLQRLIALSVSPHPLIPTNQSNNIDYELKRRRYIAKMTMIYQSMIIPALSRSGPNNADGVGYYQNAEWWGSVLQLNETGLEREKVYRTALSLQLKDRLGLLSQSSSNLMALLLSVKTEAKAEELQRKHDRL